MIYLVLMGSLWRALQLTILATDDNPGLQLYLNGEWQGVPPMKDAFIINLGDLLERWGSVLAQRNRSESVCVCVCGNLCLCVREGKGET